MRRPVLALDLATRTGWALLTSSGKVLHGAETLRHQLDARADCATRLRALEDFLELKLRHVAGGRGELVYETPVTSGRTYPASVRVACHMEGILLRDARAFLIPPQDVHGYAPSQIKRWMTGSGNASKADVLEAVEAAWGLGITDDNEADAVALLNMHLDLT